MTGAATTHIFTIVYEWINSLDRHSNRGRKGMKYDVRSFCLEIRAIDLIQFNQETELVTIEKKRFERITYRAHVNE